MLMLGNGGEGGGSRTIDLLARQALDVDNPPLAVHLHDLAVAALQANSLEL